MNSVLHNIKLVIFDLDGTLVKSNASEIPYFFEQLSVLSAMEIDSDISQYPQRTFCSVLNSIHTPNSIEVLYNELDCKMLGFAKSTVWCPLQLGEGLLELVKKQGIDYYIVTGNFKKASIQKASLAGIAIDSDKLYSTDLCSDSKLEIIKNLIADRNLCSDEVLSIGDSQYDKDIADQLGLKFLLV
ncbi:MULTISPECIES: HAD family hydrolase [Vibrio harveyi group]|nr:HAD hydrolase-like protein [Vibrio parahaemolyticus]TOA44050.1 hypothetical protein CGK25_23275 [Vibrio parahaemolyticus]TOA95012.1 hypothetical protein CGK15_22725 [Vibrio parahaemolyticus]TOO21776.1 hypothetical protein CGH41_22500 [Vibrio parahaemolyticus]